MSLPVIIIIVLLLLLIRAELKIIDLEFLLAGAIKFGPEEFDKMLKKGPPQ